MGYEIAAIAAKTSLLQARQADYRHAHLVPLAQGMAILPMIECLVQEIATKHSEAARPPQWLKRPMDYLTGCKLGHRFESLTPAVASWARQISRGGTVTYFEAQFFGGHGGQTAIVWQHGKVVFGPTTAEQDGPWPNSAISQALRILGVKRASGEDEFDSVGLGKYRSTEKWAAHAIIDGRQGAAVDAASGLVAMLEFEHESKSLQSLVRQRAADRLGSSSTDAEVAIPILHHRAKQDEDYGVRLSSTTALAAIGPEGVPSLLSLLSDPEISDQWPALYALGQLGSAAETAVPTLLPLLNAADDKIRRQAAETLGSIGPAAVEGVDALCHALKDEDTFVRSNAAKALGQIASPTKEAVAALEESLNDENEHVRHAARQALTQIADGDEQR